MKKIVLLAASLVLSSSVCYAAPIDLSGWTAVGSGNWTVQGGGDSVYQSVNTSNGTFFVSTDDYINTEFNGSFGVETTGDNDYIGFVFGYNGEDDFYLFDWKQARQSVDGYGEDGFTLAKVSDFSATNFWTHTGAGIDVLGTDYGADGTNDRGWDDNAVYDFNLLFQNNRIKISIGSEVIFDINGSFNTGKFGFYNYSQPNVRYQGFEETVVPPPNPSAVPEPTTVLLFGSGLAGLAAVGRRRKK